MSNIYLYGLKKRTCLGVLDYMKTRQKQCNRFKGGRRNRNLKLHFAFSIYVMHSLSLLRFWIYLHRSSTAPLDDFECESFSPWREILNCDDFFDVLFLFVWKPADESLDLIDDATNYLLVFVLVLHHYQWNLITFYNLTKKKISDKTKIKKRKTFV